MCESGVMIHGFAENDFETGLIFELPISDHNNYSISNLFGIHSVYILQRVQKFLSKVKLNVDGS